MVSSDIHLPLAQMFPKGISQTGKVLVQIRVGEDTFYNSNGKMEKIELPAAHNGSSSFAMKIFI